MNIGTDPVFVHADMPTRHHTPSNSDARTMRVALPIIALVTAVAIITVIAFQVELLAVPIILIAVLLILATTKTSIRSYPSNETYVPTRPSNFGRVFNGWREPVRTPVYSSSNIREVPGSGQSVFTSSQQDFRPVYVSPSHIQQPPRVVVQGRPQQRDDRPSNIISQSGQREQVGRRQ